MPELEKERYEDEDEEVSNALHVRHRGEKMKDERGNKEEDPAPPLGELKKESKLIDKGKSVPVAVNSNINRTTPPSPSRVHSINPRSIWKLRRSSLVDSDVAPLSPPLSDSIVNPIASPSLSRLSSSPFMQLDSYPSTLLSSLLSILRKTKVRYR